MVRADLMMRRAKRVYATTGDNYSDPPSGTSDAILAFDAGPGDLAWTRQITSGDAYTVACPSGVNCPKSHGPDLDFGSSAVLASLPGGKRMLVAGQKSGVVTAARSGPWRRNFWQKRVGVGGTLGGVQWVVAADESNLYVAVSDPKFQPRGAWNSWRANSRFNPSVALLIDNKAGGGLTALKLDTGEEVWRTPRPGCGDVPGCNPAQSAAVTAIPGLLFSGGLDRQLRAYLVGRRQDCVGPRHQRRLSNGQRHRGEGRLHRRRRSRHRGRHGLRGFWIRLCWKHSRQRPARLLGRRAMSSAPLAAAVAFDFLAPLILA